VIIDGEYRVVKGLNLYFGSVLKWLVGVASTISLGSMFSSKVLKNKELPAAEMSRLDSAIRRFRLWEVMPGTPSAYGNNLVLGLDTLGVLVADNLTGWQNTSGKSPLEQFTLTNSTIVINEETGSTDDLRELDQAVDALNNACRGRLPSDQRPFLDILGWFGYNTLFDGIDAIPYRLESLVSINR